MLIKFEFNNVAAKLIAALDGNCIRLLLIGACNGLDVRVVEAAVAAAAAAAAAVKLDAVLRM